MEIFKDGIRFIEREPGLKPDQKEMLIREVRKGKSPAEVLRWIWIMLTLTGPGYKKSSPHEKEELTRGLLEGLGRGPKQAGFLRIMGVFGPRLTVTKGRIENEKFFGHIVQRIREETVPNVRSRLVEILIRFSKPLPQEAQLEDFRPGLYHPDEPFRCRCLLFLQTHFQAEGLRLVIREIQSGHLRPSTSFSETLSSLIRQDPRVSRDNTAAEVSRVRPSVSNTSLPRPENRSPVIPLPGKDQRSRWDLITESQNGSIDDGGQLRLHPLIPKKEGPLLRKERLELIVDQRERG